MSDFEVNILEKCRTILMMISIQLVITIQIQAQFKKVNYSLSPRKLIIEQKFG